LTDNTWPRDAIELQLLGVWETVLDVHPLSIHDNFFELGGHSLLAVKLMSHIQQQCGVRLPVSALFQSPSVATLAQQLRQETTPLKTNIVHQLMGHSSGGRVAFEMAWQLEQQGETVAFLAILDTNAPSGKPNPMADDTELKWLSNTVLVFKNMIGVDINLSLEDLQTLQDLEAAYVQVMQAFIERQILFAPDAPIDELKVLVNTYRITSQAFDDYQIPGKLHCPIHLFRAQEKMPDAEFEDSREAWGWTECTHAKVEEHWVPGTHGTMITVPHVEILADKLAQCLRTNEMSGLHQRD
jgi:thioesterase domain-containing protein